MSVTAVWQDFTQWVWDCYPFKILLEQQTLGRCLGMGFGEDLHSPTVLNYVDNQCGFCWTPAFLLGMQNFTTCQGEAIRAVPEPWVLGLRGSWGWQTPRWMGCHILMLEEMGTSWDPHGGSTLENLHRCFFTLGLRHLFTWLNFPCVPSLIISHKHENNYICRIPSGVLANHSSWV